MQLREWPGDAPVRYSLRLLAAALLSLAAAAQAAGVLVELSLRKRRPAGGGERTARSTAN